MLSTRPVKEGCGLKTRSGGISRLVFAACNLEFNDINDTAEWCQYVAEGRIVMSSPVVGQKPKGTATKKRLSSCQSESVIGFERTVTFIDNAADNDEFRDFDFYNVLSENPSLYKFGFITCEGFFYGFVDDFTIEVDHVIEDNNLGNSFWDGIISWTGFKMLKPINIPNLVSILQGNCNQIPNFNPCTSATLSVPTNVLCTMEGIEMVATYYTSTTYAWSYSVDDVAPYVVIPGATMNTFHAMDPGFYRVTVTRSGCTPVVLGSGEVTSTRPEFDALIGVVVSPPGTAPATVTITPAVLPLSDYSYRLVVNGIPTAWQSSNVFTNVPDGTHFAQIRLTLTQCENEASFIVNP